MFPVKMKKIYSSCHLPRPATNSLRLWLLEKETENMLFLKDSPEQRASSHWPAGLESLACCAFPSNVNAATPLHDGCWGCSLGKRAETGRNNEL